jgi:RimJ/RimL family protein N-acetyltransferase
MLCHAFDVWGVHRVSLRTDARNEVSRRAIGRLGARFEGLRRAEKPGADASVRDSAFYSVLASEWPEVRRRLAALLATGHLRVRPYGPAHRDGFGSLVLGVMGELGYAADPVLEADLADPSAFYDAVWVALDGEAVVGAVAMRRLEAGEAELKRMYLLPAYRSKGLGRRLLDLALEWARTEKLVAVRLDTGSAMVDAQRFYEGAGFARCGTRTETGARDSRCELLYRLEL